MTEPIYRFPANRRAKQTGTLEQADYVKFEAQELDEAVDLSDNDCELHIIEEAWDVIQAAEGVLRKYPDALVEYMHKAVIEKCRARGDYDE